MRPNTRRNFLKGALFAAGGIATLSGLSPLVTLAQANGPRAEPRYYIFAYFSGGWDILVGLDPRDPRAFTNGNLRQTLIQPGYEMLVGSDGRMVEARNGARFGPYIGDLATHAHRIAVVRGMSMETLTHEVGRRRFITGKPPAGTQARGSSALTWLAASLGVDEPLPYVAMQTEAYTVDQPNYATALSANSVADMLRALRPSNPRLGDREDRQLDAFLSEVGACPDALASNRWQAAEAGRLRARDMVTRGLDQLFDFTAQGPVMDRLRGHYGMRANDNSPEAQAAFAAQAICGGVSRCVSIQVAGGLDTHFMDWTTNQGPNQRRGFNAIARLIEDLSTREHPGTNTSWLDHTTIVGFSEFSRTPLINERGGRDHALTNACFLAGGNIRGGAVIGASSDVGLAPQAIDFDTGELRATEDGGEVVRPEHILQTLFHDAGLDHLADLRVNPIPALLRGA